MYSLGVDIGYSSIKLLMIDGKGKVIYQSYLLHKGKIRETLSKSLHDLLCGYDAGEIEYGAVTGSGSRFLARSGLSEFVNEVAALVEGCLNTDKRIGSIIEIGSQSAKYITGLSDGDRSRIKVSMNSDCSAGTGSFIEEQVSRLGLKLEEYALYARKSRSIPRIAGRCSVFAKTDITHHQQEGVPVEDILQGLAYAMVRNYSTSVMKKLTQIKPMVFVGGVAYNKAIVDAFNQVLCLKEGDLIVPEHFSTTVALGAALIARNKKTAIDIKRLLSIPAMADDLPGEADKAVQLPCLLPMGTGDSSGRHDVESGLLCNGNLDCYLGIDVGSTSTNLVLMDSESRIVWFKYLRTLGNPVEAVRIGLKSLRQEFGDAIRIIGTGTTGSGRHLIGRLVGADVIKDEITSQAKAAVTIDPSVDTIFEIGGQDSKYISLAEGAISDFHMNKICAAGTGSFIEEQANKFSIPIGDFGDLALSSNNPVNLGERCTVFIETSVAACLAEGAKLADIASGLCYSIARNYLHRVVGHKKIGNRIFFQGGVAFNQGVINAFRALTGKEIYVPPFFSVTGAYGAAILAREEMMLREAPKTAFNGQNAILEDAGQECIVSEKKSSETFNTRIGELVFTGYNGSLDSSRKTVGIPRALFTFGMFPMFSAFFKELGFNVLLSEPTTMETVRLGQEYSLDETCYPVKLINGHVAELVEKKVDYIFFPDLYTVNHPGSHSRQNYGCAYMQLAFKMINQAMDLQSRGIELLAPTIAFSLGREFMMKSFSALAKQLGRDQEAAANALACGMKSFQQFEDRIRSHSNEVMRDLNPGEKVFVLVSKIYGVADPILNMGIPGRLMEMGYKVLGFHELPEGDISQQHPNMYWPFGQHILESAHFIRQHPDLYAIFLTHHGCGPDSVLTHYFREIMAGKPYLNVEVDEHTSDVGVITRLEAFVNSLRSDKAVESGVSKAFFSRPDGRNVKLRSDLADLEVRGTLCLPNLYPYSQIFEKILSGKGIRVGLLPAASKASIELGRAHTMTNEYFSLIALLGDVLKKLETEECEPDGITFLIPQTEGAEIDGQAHRLIRTILDSQGYEKANIFAPFIEDMICLPGETAAILFLGLLAGDLIMTAVPGQRESYCQRLLELIDRKGLHIDDLADMALEIHDKVQDFNGMKRVLAIGEPFILYNNFLNNYIFKELEEQGHWVIYAPLSEYLWLMWRDVADHGQNTKTGIMRARLAEFNDYLSTIARRLACNSPFAPDINNLITIADRTIGYYSGAFGRYREAKALAGNLSRIDGVITVASTYENTAISLNVLHKGLEDRRSKPLLSLTFDGNINENDQRKIETFMYYLCGNGTHNCIHRHGQAGPGHKCGGSSFHMHNPDIVFDTLALKEGDSFLDMGCGPGDYALHAAKIIGSSGLVYALDKNRNMIDSLMEKADKQGIMNIRAMLSDITGPLPIENGSVDACLLSTVLHIFSLAKIESTIFNEIRRALKPGGKLSIIECRNEDQNFGPPKYMCLSPGEIEASITRYGFRKVDMFDLGRNYMIQFDAQ